MPVELADGTKSNGTDKGIVRFDVGVKTQILCRTFPISTLKLNIILCSHLDKYGVKRSLPAAYAH